MADVQEKRQCAVCSKELERAAFSRKMWQNGKNGGAGRKCARPSSSAVLAQQSAHINSGKTAYKIEKQKPSRAFGALMIPPADTTGRRADTKLLTGGVRLGDGLMTMRHLATLELLSVSPAPLM